MVRPRLLLPLIIAVLLSFNVSAKSTKSDADVSIFIDNSSPSQPKIEFFWKEAIVLKSSYDKEAKELSATAKLQNLNLQDIAPLTEKIKTVSLKGGIIKAGNLTLKKGDTYSVKGKLEIQNLKATYFTKHLQLDKIKDNLEFMANLSLTVSASLPQPFTKNFISQSSYSITGAVSESEINNVPLFDTLSKVEAAFTLDNKQLKFNVTEAAYPKKVYFPSKTKKEIKTLHTNQLTAKGELTYLDTKSFSLEIKTRLSLEQFWEAAGEIKRMPFQYRGAGTIDLEGIIKGALASKDFTYYADYAIDGAQFKDFTNIKAKGFLKKDKLVVETASLNYKDIPLKIRGNVEDFTLPKIELSIDTDLLNIETKSQYSEQELDVTELVINAGTTNIISKAYLDLKDPPQGKIEGFGKLNLEEAEGILSILNLKFPLIKRLKPQGDVSLKFKIEGGFDINEWKVKVAGASNQITVYNIAAQDLTVELYRDKNEITISPLIANIASGQIELRTKLDSLNDNAVFNAAAAGIELAELKDYFNLKTKTLEGKLSLELYLKKKGLSKWGNLDGEGKVSVREGNLWQLNLLKGLGEILYIPDFETITFDKGHSDLEFAGENIMFKNLELNSTQLNLIGEGTLSLKGDIEFKLLPQLSPILISDSEKLQELINQFLGKSGLGVEIKGTLKDPEYEVTPIFISPLEGIKSIFEGILDEF
ncbi:MAG: hypothetical protein JSV34_01885 [Candidatus Omnitrophota bacterium]|nr:MAG: hypothetical protein JSV34_01885 [Candidatus Omnitrophota bacterium]